MFFKQVEGEAAILIENGIYKQVDLYTRDGYLYAKVAGGFVRLMADGSTTKARCKLSFMSWTGALHRDTMGRLCTSEASCMKRSLDEGTRKLLGGSTE